MSGLPTVTSEGPGPNRWVAAVLMMLTYYGIQGLTLLLGFAPRMLPAETLKQHPWIRLYEHHAWQLVLALVLIGILGRGRFAEWGLNFRNARLSWRILGRFCLVYSLVVFVVGVLPPLLSHRAPAPDGFGPVAVAGWLSFQWLFVGISEEILFRGLIHTYLARSWRGVWRAGGVVIPTAGVVTTAIFCLAHVDPLHPHVDWLQQVWALGLGLYYSTVYHRTGSLLNPILAHDFADGLVVTVPYLLHGWMR
jgi:CAAX protease family protein